MFKLLLKKYFKLSMLLLQLMSYIIRLSQRALVIVDMH